MRFILLFVLILAIGTFLSQLFSLRNQEKTLKDDLSKIEQQISPLTREREELSAEIDYFSKPEHLEDELRKNGYALPEEKMMVIIPKQ